MPASAPCAVSASLRRSSAQRPALWHRAHTSAHRKQRLAFSSTLPAACLQFSKKTLVGSAWVLRSCFRILAWGRQMSTSRTPATCQLCRASSSGATAYHVTHVVIERQLGQRNVQAGRIEADTEALLIARGNQVRVLPSEYIRVRAELSRLAAASCTVHSLGGRGTR